MVHTLEAAGDEPLHVVILAAGKGTRMRSARPKVLHEIGGKPMLARVLETATALRPQAVHVVVGHGAQQVREAVPVADVHWVEQAEQRGTGHALQQVLPALPPTGKTLVLYGDVPLIDVASLSALLAAAQGEALGVLTDVLDNPFGYGRIVRDAAGGVAAIVEEKDASDAQRRLREINTGILALPNARLAGWLQALRPSNAQGELYLTDLIAMAAAAGVPVRPVPVAAHHLAAGVNDRAQLAALERAFQHDEAQRLMREGVTLRDPARFDLRGTLRCGQDVVLDANVLLEGECVLGDGVRVGANCVLKNVVLGAGTVVAPFSHLEECTVGANVRIGPYARLRPGAQLADDVHVGNFVEIKKSTLARGAKVNHLTYVGDADIGEKTNVGAGTVVAPFSHLEECAVGANVRIGPYARLRPGAQLADDVHVGNFVEIKKSTLARGAKVNHLTYVGDADIGEKTNVGAGTVTCNYDGVNKFRTEIGANCFIGSGALLVAPVRVNDGATVGAGSVIVRDCPPESLNIARGRQVCIADWQRPQARDKDKP